MPVHREKNLFFSQNLIIVSAKIMKLKQELYDALGSIMDPGWSLKFQDFSRTKTVSQTRRREEEGKKKWKKL